MWCNARMSWELIDHTGDIGVAARAPTLEELFAECARAMFSVLADSGTPAPTGLDAFPVPAADPAEELRDFLSELLYRFSAGWEPYDATRHPLRTELKAVTYHQLEVVRDGDGWKGRVIFDV